MLEKNKSYDNIEQESNEGEGNKDESFQLDPLTNPNKLTFNKTKNLEDSQVGQMFEKRKGLNTGSQKKRKKLKPRDIVDSKVS